MNGQGAYLKFKTIITAAATNDQIGEANRSVLLQTAEKYYELAEPTIGWPTIKEQYERLDMAALKKLVLELCAESINRDYINYIMHGQVGDFGRQLYAILKQQLK